MEIPAIVHFLFASLALFALASAAVAQDANQRLPSCRVNGGQVNVLDCGADPTGRTDSTAAISAAHTSICSAGGGAIFYPPGTYIINPHRAAFTVCSHLKEYGTATLRVSPSTGDFAFIFGPPPGAGAVLSDLMFDGLTIDENSINNALSVPKIAPCNSGTGAANGPFTCYQTVFWFQGNYNGTVKGLTLTNLTVYSGGVSILTATDGAAKGAPSKATRDITVVNNEFIFEKRRAVPNFDNSALYIDAANVTVQGNLFTTLNRSALDGATTAIEFHSGPGTVIGNTIDWYRLGAYLANSTRSNFIDNVISHALSGLSLFQLYPMDSDTIAGNVITLNNADRYGPGSANTFGIALGNNASVSAAVSNIRIEGNSITFQQDTNTQHSPNPFNSGGISLFTYGSLQGAEVENNDINNSPVSCVNVGTSKGTSGAVDNATVANNHMTDCGTLPSTKSFNSAVWMSGKLTGLQVHHNVVKFTTNPFMGHYAFLDGSVEGSGGFVAENSVTAASGNPSTNITPRIGRTLPREAVNAGSSSRLRNDSLPTLNSMLSSSSSYPSITTKQTSVEASCAAGSLPKPCQVAQELPTLTSSETTSNGMSFTPRSTGVYRVCGGLKITTTTSNSGSVYINPTFTSKGALNTTLIVSGTNLPSTMPWAYGTGCSTITADANKPILLREVFNGTNGAMSTYWWATIDWMQ